MNDQNPEVTPDNVAQKSRFRNPFRNSETSIKEKTKTVLAAVGVLTVAGVVVGTVAKRRGVTGVEVSLPDVDVTADAS